jgi:RNA polymerase sigma factor (sigma-70 family)
VQDSDVGAVVERLEALYRSDGQKIWRSLYASSRSLEVADDALAEAFAQALARGEEIRDPAAWVWRVAFLVAGREMQRRASLSHVEDLNSHEMPLSVVEVMKALRSLSPNQRLVILMHDYADRPTDEIAALLGSSRATVHVHLSKGRRRLRALLEADDG